MTSTETALLTRAIQAWKDFDKTDRQYRQENDEDIAALYHSRMEAALVRLDTIYTLAQDLTGQTYDEFAMMIKERMTV